MRPSRLVVLLLAGCVPALEADCSAGGCPTEQVCRVGVCLTAPDADGAPDGTTDQDAPAEDAERDRPLLSPDVAEPVPDGPIEAPCPEGLVDADRDPSNGCERGCRLEAPESVGTGRSVAVARSEEAVGIAVAGAERLLVAELGGGRAVAQAVGRTLADPDLVGTGTHWVASAFDDAAAGGRVLALSLARAGGSTAVRFAPDAVRGPSLAVVADGVAFVVPTAQHVYLGMIRPSRPAEGDPVCLDCDATAAPAPVRPAVFVVGEALWVVHVRTDARVAVTRVDASGQRQWVAAPASFPLDGDLSATPVGDGEWLLGSGAWRATLRLDAPDRLVPAPWSLGAHGALLTLADGPAWFGLDDDRAVVVPLSGTDPRGLAVLREGVRRVDAVAGDDGAVVLATAVGAALSVQRLRCW